MADDASSGNEWHQDGRGAADFFVSYVPADEEWAQWISWVLEEAGYQVLVEAWDVVAGASRAGVVNTGLSLARHVLAVVSGEYLRSAVAAAEWQAVWAADPRGLARRLVPVRVEACELPGALGPLASIDLFDRDGDHAGRRLLDQLAAARCGRARPAHAPPFPTGSRPPGRGAGAPGAPARSGPEPVGPDDLERSGVHVQVGGDLTGQLVVGSHNSLLRSDGA
ncbi:toll/interleukin-1 receptor domain-containing protein [Frankia sp. AgKG'84/4]|uniref:toll/interleukin-1 receptor domain-containing protein n=1 Tax=Frankia sp. AgKG'84/4 TaxID=573490 RepID=UPI00200CA561|nr:toll/interleukin-1 receptor domain-containing protein [Frankia sp. AgKG'84/4]MCL9798467.1 toll/interleukin-1 receptor domain-containing protein [Frankia sp. AgKG'84/4]